MTENPIVIYHNARCSKSRSACELIAARGLNARIIDYLAHPPGKEELRSLLNKLGMRPAELVRRGEEIFKTHYAGKTLSDDEWLDALVSHPHHDSGYYCGRGCPAAQLVCRARDHSRKSNW